MCKLLIVDDDKDLLEVIDSLLTSKGFQVQTDLNWEKGFSNLEEFAPQLILMDVFLAGIDGLDICKQLKNNPLTRDLPVIIFSAYPRVAQKAIYEYGADDFIAKPFEVEDLINKVHSVLSLNSSMA